MVQPPFSLGMRSWPRGPDPHPRAAGLPGRGPGLVDGEPALGLRTRAPTPLRGSRRGGGLPPTVAGVPGLGGMGRCGLAGGLWRAGCRSQRALHPARRAGPGPGPGDGRSHRAQSGRSHLDGPRYGRPEGPLAVSHPNGGRPVVPAVQRARCGQRPGRCLDPGLTGGGWVADQRPEGVDQLRPVRRLGRLPGPDRPRRAQAQGHLLSGRRHAPPGSQRATPGATDRRGRVQRGVPQRRVRARRSIDRPRTRGMAGGQLHALARTRRQPPPAGHPHAAAGGAAAPGRDERRLRRAATTERAGRGLRGDPDLSAPQPAQRQPAVPRSRPRARGQCAQAVLERDVQAVP